ncbi:MAG: PTS system mannose/fructose/sorbose family transporter subunit IID [Longimicrobiales bacterium]|nr:PTS system mannose/fructose/sorbose family transporter subunit IID [Longimicrobiales bacterium]
MTGKLPRTTVISIFLRSLLIQGAWNYHTMLGAGFGFSMLPGLRRLFPDDPAAVEAALDRHLEHFNAHPYLASVALGASLRMESEREDAETIRRFKIAVRGPLGSLGDALVWATWLPAVSVSTLALFWIGLPGWAAICLFLVVYNVGHLWLRAWGLRTGLEAGRNVGRRLAEADLTGLTARLQPLLVLALGGLAGALIGGQGGLGESGAGWVGLAACGFGAGVVGGHRTWRPAAIATVSAIGLIAAWGVSG